jgi:hypothetical protein
MVASSKERLLIKVMSSAMGNGAGFFRKSLIIFLLDSRKCSNRAPASMLTVVFRVPDHGRRTLQRRWIRQCKVRFQECYLHRTARNDHQLLKKLKHVIWIGHGARDGDQLGKHGGFYWRNIITYQDDQSGWWDLNPRPPGPEPGALPS